MMSLPKKLNWLPMFSNGRVFFKNDTDALVHKNTNKPDSNMPI